MRLHITLLIPLLLIILALVSSFLVYIDSSRTAAKSIRAESLARLNLDITRLQNILYNLLTESSENIEAARLNLSVTAMDPGFKSLLLTNEENTILVANYYLWAGKHAEQVTDYNPVIAQQVIQTNSPVYFFDDMDETILTGYYPVILKLESEQGLPVKRIGVLFSELSIATRLNRAEVNATNQSLIFAGLMLAASFIIALLLHCLVSKRLARLTKTAEKLTAGNYEVRANIGGQDELTRLGSAFDDMVSRLKSDISRRENAENELRELNESLAEHIEQRTHELNEKKQQLYDSQALTHQASKMTALGELASGIAHEINSPLQSLSLLTYRLKRAIEKKDYESFGEISDKISNAIDTVSNIVDSLSKMSRESSGDAFLEERIKNIIDDVLSITSERYRLYGIRLRVKYDDSCENQTLKCQRIRIGQIIANLLNNACDAALESEEKWIDINIYEENDNICIAVSDSGKGIQPEFQEKIFEPMFTTKDIGKGTGLGLSISSEIARQHTGSLAIDTDVTYTAFILTLPKNKVRKNG